MKEDRTQFEVRIPSEYEPAQAVVERIMTIVDRAGFDDRDQFGIRLSVDEAVTNAVKHGNCGDSRKSVRIHFQLDPKKVRIEIEDQGNGFRPEDVPDPTAEENLERSSGRGLLLMRAYMTRIEYNAKGNLVVLEKTRE